MFRFLKNKPKQSDFTPVYRHFQQNIDEVKKRFSYPVNSDFQCRMLSLDGGKKKAALFYLASIVNDSVIQQNVIKPLLDKNRSEDDIPSRVTVDKVSVLDDFSQITDDILIGNAVLFTDSDKKSYSFGTAEFQHRKIDKPENENAIRGPKEAFTESSIVNLSLLRKRLPNENLIAETIPVGSRTKSDVTVLYIKDLANNDVLETVKDRITSIDADSVRTVEMLEQYIEDRPYSIAPTVLYTERPDRAAAFLEDGYIVLAMNNSSACLIVPVTFWSFVHSPEDHYLRFLFGNFSRFIRVGAFFITLFISALYIAITTFHSEMIPPDLLLAIASAREKVPFPTVFEVIIMEFAFELIREAGLRLPATLGPTIGIFGALVLGQAAVQANLISPIIVIVAALSGLSSFAMTDVSFNFLLRLSRFIFILSAALYGMLGLSIAFLLWNMYIVSIKSFGVPFLAPLTPYYVSSKDTVFRNILQKEKFRPGYLKVRDVKKKGPMRE
ncbi:spore germination protein [Bacillus marinisedimentorum]|uniref:spore germination protein n=1 Tax=Bacillus marinisedimentorum TaxID=1821260 RepID=UPI000871F366|nr:spore germination protein [Bacillus marinisedimentorum]